MNEKIYFTLYTNMPQEMTATYRGRTKSIGVMIVPAVMGAHIEERSLLFEEEILLTEKYLRDILIN